MQVSPTKAAKIANVTRKTLYADMKKGTLSFEVNEKGRRLINIAELERVYAGEMQGKRLKKELENKEAAWTKTEAANLDKSREAELLEAHIETLKAENKYLKEQLKDQSDHFKVELKSKDETYNTSLRLLTDQRTGQGAKEVELEKKLQKMDDVIQELRSQNERFQKKEEDRQKRVEERRKQKEIEAAAERERNKSIFKRLFG